MRNQFPTKEPSDQIRRRPTTTRTQGSEVSHESTRAHPSSHCETGHVLYPGKKTACHRASRRSIEVKKPSGDPGRAHEPLHVLVSSTGKITARLGSRAPRSPREFAASRVDDQAGRARSYAYGAVARGAGGKCQRPGALRLCCSRCLPMLRRCHCQLAGGGAAR